jgi:hypothetical protein
MTEQSSELTVCVMYSLKPANVLVANKLSQGEISGRADNDDPNDGGPRDALDERLHGGLWV